MAKKVSKKFKIRTFDSIERARGHSFKSYRFIMIVLFSDIHNYDLGSENSIESFCVWW